MLPARPHHLLTGTHSAAVILSWLRSRSPWKTVDQRTLTFQRMTPMSERIVALLACIVLAGPTLPALAQKDDTAEKFPAPPKGFDVKRDGIEHGKLETVEYDSTTVG